MRPSLAGCLSAILLCAAAIAASKPADAPPPVLVVFDFEAVNCPPSLGEKIAEMFRGHALRRRAFQLIEQADLEELIAGAHRPPVTLGSDPAALAEWAERTFGAEIIIWGRIERIRPDAYRLHARVLDLREDANVPVLSKTYDSTLHGTVRSVDAVLDEILHVEREPPRDLLADTSWRQRPNLVVNGDFERGDGTPEGWEPVDGLCSFWVDGVSPDGKCVMFDTMVLESQYAEWRKAFERGASAQDAPAKIPPRPPYYDTVGGTVGAHLYSDPIRIQQGKTYRLDFDFLGPGGATKVFVKGYAPFRGPHGIVHREVYRTQVDLHPKRADQWEHFARLMHPSQPFLLLTIRSSFDDNATGDRLRALLADRLAKFGVRPIADLAETRRKIADVEEQLCYDASKFLVEGIVRTRFGRGVVVWGEVAPQDAELKVRLRSLDVRPDATTKDWWNERTVKPDALEREAERIAADIVENARLVTFLRVKLDAYWPPGDYYFDNVWITEEPEDAGSRRRDGE